MAKKKNLYNGIEYDNLKKELDSIVLFVENLNCQTIEDDIDETGVRPRILAKIEDKIKVTLNTIKEAISILTLIVDREGMNAYVESKVFTIKNCISQIQYYYGERPIDKLNHREFGYVSIKGIPSVIMVCSSYQQVTDRTMITKKILEILPFLDKVGEKVTSVVEVRGSKEMDYWLVRKLRKEGKL